MVGYDDIHSQCFKDTVTAYQKVRQDGQLHIPAFIAALKAYKRHEGITKLKTQVDKCKSTSHSPHHSTLRSTGTAYTMSGG